MDLSKVFAILEKDGKIELTADFKSQIQDVFNVALVEKTTEIETGKTLLKEATDKIETLNTEIASLKEGIVTNVQEEVTKFKDSLVEKIDSFLESELETLIPEDLIEAKAKLEVYEPIVEGFKETIAKFGIQIESEGHQLLKDAKEEIESLTEDVNTKTKEHMELEEAAGKLLAKVTLMEKCEGLTTEQKEKIGIIFAGKSVDEINEKFDNIRDLIINDKATEIVTEKVADVTETVADATTVITEKVEDLGQKYLRGI